MAMQTTGSNQSGEPMMDINMTPLIDVLLVLIIMLIITIPPQSHAVKLDLPQDQSDVPPPPIDPVKNKVVVTQAGAVLWNGAPVNLTQLRQYLTSRSRWTRSRNSTCSRSRRRATRWSIRCLR